MLKFDKSNKLEYFYAVLIFINNFAFGVCINLFFATLVDLSYIYETSINAFSSINIAFCVGYMIGSLASFIYKYVNRQLALAIFVSVQAVALFLLPFYGKFWLVFSMMIVMNLGAGAWEAAANAWIAELFPRGHSVAFQTNQFMYGLGSISANLLASPFVYGTKNVTAVNQTISVDDRIASLSIPFTIAGIAQAIVPTLLFLTFFICPYVKNDSETISPPEVKSIEQEYSSKVGKIPKVVSKLTQKQKHACTVLLGISFCTYIAAEFGFITFSTSMYQYSIELTADKAAQITALLLTTYTFGRLATALLLYSFKLRNDVIILCHFLIQLSSLAFLYFGRNNLSMIYIGTITLGYGFSALNPSILAFTQETVGLTERVCSMYTFLVGGTCLVTPLILSQLFHSYPIILILLSSTLIGISFSIFIFVRLWIGLDK